MAIASVRDEAHASPPEAVDALVDALTHEDNRGNLYDDSGFLSSLLQGLGYLAPANPKVILSILASNVCSSSGTCLWEEAK